MSHPSDQNQSGGTPQQGGPTGDRPGGPPPQPWGPPPPYAAPWGPPQQQWGPPSYPPPGWGPPPYPVHPGWGPPPPWAAPGPPQQTAMPSFPHPEPRAYHQMLLTWNYAWWKPVVGVIVTLVAMVLVAPLVLFPLLALGVAFEGGSYLENLERAATLQDVTPAALLYLNIVLGSTILITWFVVRVFHRMRPRWLTSVVPKMRWKFFLACLGLSVLALIAQLVVGLLLPGDQQGEMGDVQEFTLTTGLLIAVVMLTTPFQAAGEEYVFRGYLLQATGSFWSFSWVRPWMARWLAIVGTALLFAVAHGVQNFPLFFDRFAFGLVAGWLVIRTGGLEAGIALHILNNFLAFGFAITFGGLTESLNISEVGWSNILLTITQMGLYAVLVLLVARAMKLQTRTRPPEEYAVRGRYEPSQGPMAVPSGAGA